MARLRYVDLSGTIGSGNLTNSATSHTFTAPLTYAAGTTVPTLAGADYFLLTILNTAGTAVSEVVKVTAYNSSTGAATIVRGQEGTTGAAHTSADKVTLAAYPSDLARSPMGMPQGDFLRAYTFDSTTESWATTSCTLTSTSSRLVVSGIASGVASLFTEPLATADVADGEFSMDVLAGTGGTVIQAGLMFRIVDTSNFYWLGFRFNETSNLVAAVELYKCVAGAFTSLAATTPLTYRIPLPGVGALNTRLMVRFVGTSIQAFLNDTFVLGATDSTFTTGNVGMRVFGTATQTLTVDNAYVYTLPSTWQPDSPRGA